MIQKVIWGQGANGLLEMTYSDKGKYIERDGTRYETALDPVGSNRKYKETKEKIPNWKDPTITEADEDGNSAAEGV